MRAWELVGFGEDALGLAERDIPGIAPGELLHIGAVALNHRNLAIAAGHYAPDPPLPLIPGSDAVSRVVHGGDVRGQWAPGDRVIGCCVPASARDDSQPENARDQIFDFSAAPDAFARLAGGDHQGTICIDMTR